MRNFETRDYYDSRGKAKLFAQNPELPQWLRNAWQAVADGRISSPADYHEGMTLPPATRAAPAKQKRAFMDGCGFCESERAGRPVTRRAVPSVPHRETIAQRVQRENRERVLKLMSRRYDPYLED